MIFCNNYQYYTLFITLKCHTHAGEFYNCITIQQSLIQNIKKINTKNLDLPTTPETIKNVQLSFQGRLFLVMVAPLSLQIKLAKIAMR